MDFCKHAHLISNALDACESPIEHLFWHEMAKTAPFPWRHVEAQAKFGRYRVDALLLTEEDQIAVELDGKDYHSESRDKPRDLALLTKHGFTWVVHIPGSTIQPAPNATMRVLAEWWPAFTIRWEAGVIRRAELEHEMAATTDSDGTPVSTSEFLHEHNFFYEVWDATEHTGLVATPAAVLFNWNVRLITRRRRPCQVTG